MTQTSLTREALMDFTVYLGNKQVPLDHPTMTYQCEALGPRHEPISYREFYETILDQFNALGLKVYQTAHATTSKGATYFGIAELACESSTVVPIVGWRSSHNQRVSATLYLGAGLPEQNIVTLTNEIKIFARQTIGFQERLPSVVQEGLQHLDVLSKQQSKTFARFRRMRLSSMEAEQAIIEMIRQEVINPSKAKNVIDEWDMPQAQFLRGSRNVWRLFHAAAESYKPMGETDAISILLDRSPLLMAFMKDLTMNKTMT